MREKIIRHINKMFENKRICGFREEYIIRKFSISKEEFDNIMKEFINEGKIELLYEVKCKCLSGIKVVKTIDEALDNIAECNICGNSFVIDEYDIFPYYKFKKE